MPWVIPRDLFPIATGETLADYLHGKTSASGTVAWQRRMRRRRPEYRLTVSALGSLNDLAGVSGEGVERPFSLAQSTVVDRVQGDCRLFAETVRGVVPERAWNELRKTRCGYGDQDVASPVGSVVNFQRGAMKLPSTGGGSIPLAAHLRASLSSCLESGQGILRPASEVGTVPLTLKAVEFDPFLFEASVNPSDFL